MSSLDQTAARTLGGGARRLARPALDAHLALSIGLAFAAMALALRVAAFKVAVFDGDEYAFALVARDVLHGAAPDAGVFDNKPVGLTYLFALAEQLGGQGVFAIRALGFAASAALAGLLYVCGRRLGLSRALALTFGALAVLGSLCLGGFASMSELMAAPLLAAADLLLLSGARRTAPLLAAAGAVLGLACQLTYLAAPCAALTLAGLLLPDRERPFRARLGDGVLAGFACGLAALAVWIPQLLAGAWGAFAAEQVRYHHGYRAVALNWDDWCRGFAVPLATVCLPILTAWLSRGPRSARPLPAAVWPLALQLVGAALAATASNRFYAHYLILALPAGALLTAVLLADAPARRRRAAWVVLALLSAATTVASVGYLGARLQAPSLEADAAAAVDRLARPGRSIFVFDEAHAIYFLARRPAASRYVFPTHYLSSCDGAPAIADPTAVLAQALARRPALVLVGAECPPEIDAPAQVRRAGYRIVERLEDGPRRIAVYAPAIR